ELDRSSGKPLNSILPRHCGGWLRWRIDDDLRRVLVAHDRRGRHEHRHNGEPDHEFFAVAEHEFLPWGTLARRGRQPLGGWPAPCRVHVASTGQGMRTIEKNRNMLRYVAP